MYIFHTKRTLFSRDFNYRDISWEKNTSGSTVNPFLKFINQLSLVQCVKEKTRGENILDLAFVYNKEFITKLEILPPLSNSDHSVISVRVNVPRDEISKKIKYYNYEKGNYYNLSSQITNIIWKQ